MRIRGRSASVRRMSRGIPRAVIDLGLPLGLLALGVVEIAPSSSPNDYPPPHWAHLVLLAAISGALVFRRRRPTTVFAAVGLLTGVWIWVLYHPAQQQGPLEGFLGLLLAFYALGAYAERRGLMLAVPFVVLGLASDVVALVQGRPAGNSLPSWIFYGAIFAFGRVLRSRLRLARALSDRAAQLEVEREEKARRAVLDERARIARELHDVISHAVSVMVVQASAERRALGDAPGTTRETLATIERTGREALVELRRLLGVLRHTGDEPSLVPQPGLAELTALVAQAREAGLEAELEVEGELESLPPGVDLSAYRIVQESLTNVIKHASASRVTVAVRRRRDRIEIEVRDDGRGREPGAGGGHGLIGMRERAALYGGSLEAGPASGGGWRVGARLPVEAEAPVPVA
jgi:signal transduction histidine kinase